MTIAFPLWRPHDGWLRLACLQLSSERLSWALTPEKRPVSLRLACIMSHEKRLVSLQLACIASHLQRGPDDLALHHQRSCNGATLNACAGAIAPLLLDCCLTSRRHSSLPVVPWRSVRRTWLLSDRDGQSEVSGSAELVSAMVVRALARLVNALLWSDSGTRSWSVRCMSNLRSNCLSAN